MKNRIGNWMIGNFALTIVVAGVAISPVASAKLELVFCENFFPPTLLQRAVNPAGDAKLVACLKKLPLYNQIIETLSSGEEASCKDPRFFILTLDKKLGDMTSINIEATLVCEIPSVNQVLDPTGTTNIGKFAGHTTRVTMKVFAGGLVFQEKNGSWTLSNYDFKGFQITGASTPESSSTTE